MTTDRPAELPTLALRCEACGMPWAEIRDGRFVVSQRHHGDRHVNSLDLEALKRMLRMLEQDRAMQDA